MSDNSIISHYESCLEKHKNDPYLAVDWLNKDAAKIRYRRMLDFYYEFFLESSEFITMLDWGCGLGNLIDHISPFIDYAGYDASEKMIAAAKELHSNYNFTSNLEELKAADVVIMNGVLTEKIDLSWADMYTHSIKTIRKALEYTNKGLIVNFMNWHSITMIKQREELFFLKLDQVAALAEKVGIKKYKIDASYLPYEIALCLYKGDF